MKKEVYILVGPAAIGKTTFIKKMGFPEEQTKIISRDECVKVVSLKNNLTYDEMYSFPPKDSKVGEIIPGFERFGKVIESPDLIKYTAPLSYEILNDINTEVHNSFYQNFQDAINNPSILFIIVDRVHLRKEERTIYWMYLIPRSQFFVVVILFNFHDVDTLDVIEQASAIRKLTEKRTVPRQIQEKMISFYEEPTLEDGFDKVIKIDTLPAIREFIATSNK